MKKWLYNILLLDDNSEQLEMLESEIQRLCLAKTGYRIRILAVTSTFDAILNSSDADAFFDVMVLDVAKGSLLKSQLHTLGNFVDYYKILRDERGDLLCNTKVYAYTKLDLTIAKNEFEGADIEYLCKKTTSIENVAQIIVSYIDKLFCYEQSKDIEYKKSTKGCIQMNQQRIYKIDELLNYVNELHTQHGLRLWYRGVANSSWALIPSIQRDRKRINAERFITNDFYMKAKRVLDKSPVKKDYAGWMSLMQHYGLPTRLLDWSRSPLIAAFFATEQYNDFPDIDACIWVLAPGLLNEVEGFGDCIFPADADTVQDMLLPAFKEHGYNPEVADKLIACHSIDNNLRMYSQQACFTIHNSERKLEDICTSSMLYKILIPAGARKYFIDSLEVFGITEVLYTPISTIYLRI